MTDNFSNFIPGIAGWRWVFYVNISVGMLALWFILAKMPQLPAHNSKHKLNYLSSLLMMSGFLPLILALQLDKTHYPWGSSTIILLLAFSGLMLAIWIIHSLKSKNPVLDLRLFAQKVFMTANIATFFYGAGFMGVIIFLPLYMVNVQGVSATGAGLTVIPLSMGMVFGAVLSGQLASKLGTYKLLITLGAIIALFGSICMNIFGLGTPYHLAVVIMILTGIGLGPAQTLYSLAIQNDVSQLEMGQATSAMSKSGAGVALPTSGLQLGLSAAFASSLNLVWLTIAISFGISLIFTLLIPDKALRSNNIDQSDYNRVPMFKLGDRYEQNITHNDRGPAANSQ